MNWSKLKYIHTCLQSERSALSFDQQLFKNSNISPKVSAGKFFRTLSNPNLQPNICEHCLKLFPAAHLNHAKQGLVKKKNKRFEKISYVFERKLHTSTEKKRKPWKVLFFGTDLFSVRVLQILNENRNLENQNVIEKLDVLSTKGETQVRAYAASAGLSILDWPVHSLSGQYNVGVLASFGHLIPERVISSFPNGILNVHPSLLPRWRGASPIVHTILSRDQLTGVSIMKLRPKHFDTGPILSKKEVPVPDHVTAFQLRDLLAEQGGQLLVNVLQRLPSLSEVEQSSEGVTYAHKVSPSMTYINWQRATCEDVFCQYCAFGEYLPLRSKLNEQGVKLIGFQHLDVEAESDSSIAGTVMFDKEKQILCVKCVNGWVGFEHIVIKKTMTAKEFYNGYLSKMADRKLVFTSVSNGLEHEAYTKRILLRR